MMICLLSGMQERLYTGSGIIDNKAYRENYLVSRDKNHYFFRGTFSMRSLYFFKKRKDRDTGKEIMGEGLVIGTFSDIIYQTGCLIT